LEDYEMKSLIKKIKTLNGEKVEGDLIW
jgi:hypothetical protein